MPTRSPSNLDYSRFPVLYVDDEPSNLRAFELAFRRDFSIVKAKNGHEGLARLAENPIAVVLSDHRMPEMMGTEFLARVREMAPRTVRLLVTAYGDAGTLAEAINDGFIYRYVAKPWDPDEMRAIIRQAIGLYALEAERGELIAELRTLNEISQRLAARTGLDSLIDCVYRAIVSDLHFDGVSLFLTDREASVLRLHSTFPRIEGHEFLAGLSSEGSPHLFSALRAGQPVRLTRGHVRDSSSEMRSVLTMIGSEEVVALPLSGRNRLLGLLAVDNRRGGKAIMAGRQTLLQGLAAQFSVCLENAFYLCKVGHQEIAESAVDMESAEIDRALGNSMVRETSRALERVLAGQTAMAPSAKQELRLAMSVVEGFGEMLTRHDPARCDLGERVETARAILGKWCAEKVVRVDLELAPSTVEVKAPPGRLLQLLVHMIEWAAMTAGAGGVVTVLGIGDPRRPGLRLFAKRDHKSIEESKMGQGEDADRSEVVVCGLLASEIDASVSISNQGDESTWTLSLPVE